MPKESLSIYLTAVDGISPVLASITDKTKALDKESQQLTQTYEALQKANKSLIAQKTELQKQLQQVNEEVKEARKQFKELGDEASSDAYEKAQEKQQKLRNEIAATTKSLQENQKIYKENIETIRKGGIEEQGTSLKNSQRVFSPDKSNRWPQLRWVGWRSLYLPALSALRRLRCSRTHLATPFQELLRGGRWDFRVLSEELWQEAYPV